jgi:hypothetical protein
MVQVLGQCLDSRRKGKIRSGETAQGEGEGDFFPEREGSRSKKSQNQMKRRRCLGAFEGCGDSSLGHPDDFQWAHPVEIVFHAQPLKKLPGFLVGAQK